MNNRISDFRDSGFARYLGLAQATARDIDTVITTELIIEHDIGIGSTFYFIMAINRQRPHGTTRDTGTTSLFTTKGAIVCVTTVLAW